ncbi:MAG: hypothetical protein HW416_447 [Chloroflexi bacterium]|nr:hypothetical protein [Chloroflexota bacterium]
MEDRNESWSGGEVRSTPYWRWQHGEGVPIYYGSFVEDLHTAEVGFWPRVGQKGAIVNLAEQEKNDGWLIEIAPGAHTDPLHHVFESTSYVLDGRGATTIWQPGSSAKQTVEWQAGCLFSPPLNCYYQHFNLDGQKPTRLFSATSAPLMMNVIREDAFIFDNPYVFNSRYGADDDYFTDPGKRLGNREWETNFLPDVRGFGLDDFSERGGTNMFFRMSANQMSAHISEFPPGTYKKAHRHNAGAELLIVKGTGYSLLWFKDQEPEKVDWKDGTIFSPRNAQYHQHFNTGPTNARYLAFGFWGLVVMNRGDYGAARSEQEGGWQIEYGDENPKILALFERECAAHGAKVTLPHPFYAPA